MKVLKQRKTTCRVLSAEQLLAAGLYAISLVTAMTFTTDI